jgi:hypothetical protein
MTERKTYERENHAERDRRRWGGQREEKEGRGGERKGEIGREENRGKGGEGGGGGYTSSTVTPPLFLAKRR